MASFWYVATLPSRQSLLNEAGVGFENRRNPSVHLNLGVMVTHPFGDCVKTRPDQPGVASTSRRNSSFAAMSFLRNNSRKPKHAHLARMLTDTTPPIRLACVAVRVIKHGLHMWIHLTRDDEPRIKCFS